LGGVRPRPGRTGGEQGDVEPGRVGGLGVLGDDVGDGAVGPAPRQRRARRPRRCEVPHLVDREAPLLEETTHHAADLTSCTNDPDTHVGKANAAPSLLNARNPIAVADPGTSTGLTHHQSPSSSDPVLNARVRSATGTPNAAGDTSGQNWNATRGATGR